MRQRKQSRVKHANVIQNGIFRKTFLTLPSICRINSFADASLLPEISSRFLNCSSLKFSVTIAFLTPFHHVYLCCPFSICHCLAYVSNQTQVSLQTFPFSIASGVIFLIDYCFRQFVTSNPGIITIPNELSTLMKFIMRSLVCIHISFVLLLVSLYLWTVEHISVSESISVAISLFLTTSFVLCTSNLYPIMLIIMTL